MAGFNQFVAFLLIGSMLVFQPSAVWALEYPSGDINADGAIDEADVAPLRDLVMERTGDFRAYTQGDFNRDGVRDVADALAILNYNGDWDNDGVSDAVEAVEDPVELPFDPERWPENSQSEFPDLLKLDQNSDGFSESVSAYRVDSDSTNDTDKDGTPDYTDGDDDNDGIPDADEEVGWTHTSPPSPVPAAYDPGPFKTDALLADTDRDGLSDGQERSSYNTNPLNPDSDGDGYADGTEAGTSDPLDPASVPGKVMPDLTVHERTANNQWQAEQRNLRMEKSGTAGSSSGRGLGFQGPEAIGANFDSVQSDQFTGAFSYSIPVKVPPGRNGMQPSLALAYRSINSHSWLGQGWDLNPGRIERSTKNGPPKYDDASNPPAHDGDPMTPLDNPDVYVYSTSAGGMQLTFTGTQQIGGETCGIYHAEVESGSFVRFIHHPDPMNEGGGWWEAWMKDGRKAWFGGKGAFDKNTCLYDPNHFSDATDLFAAGWGVFQWGLSREEDLSGNALVYDYQKPAGTSNMFLANIFYNYDGAIPMVRIEFTVTPRGSLPWASYRESYKPKFKMVSDHFLTSITEYVSGRPLERVRKYVLQYWDLDFSKARTISCLKNLQEYGETDMDSFPAIRFTYSENPGGWEHHVDDGYPYILPYPIARDPSPPQEYVSFGDFNGDALPDAIWTSDARPRHIAMNTGSGWLPDPINASDPLYFDMWSCPSWIAPYSAGLDLNQDGLGDLIIGHVAGGGGCNYYSGGCVPFSRSLLSNGKSFSSLYVQTTGLWNMTDGYVQPESGYVLQCPAYCEYDSYGGSYGLGFGDVNGDGLIDALWRGFEDVAVWGQIEVPGTPCTNPRDYPPNYVSINDGQRWQFDCSNAHAYSIQTPWVYLTAFAASLMDYNGDGLSDVVSRIADGSWDVAATGVNNGVTFQFTTGAHPYKLPDYTGEYGRGATQWVTRWDYGARFADFNGDGLVDIVWSSNDTVANPERRSVAINTGTGWSFDNSGAHPYTPRSAFTNRRSDYTNWTYGATISDFNGDGMPDIIWSRTDSGGNFSVGGRREVSLNTGQKPNLLRMIENGIGGTVEVEYTPQTRARMKLYDPETGQVEINDKVPFVLYVVSKITKAGSWPADGGGLSIQSYSTLYRYAGGKYLDREFRGFGKVKQIDAATGNFSITEFHQDFARKGMVRSTRSYVGDRRDYRTDGTINGPIKTPAQESTPAYPPRMVSEAHTRYRVVIHAEDNDLLKTFTDTHAKLDLTDFPKGMTLVTPACSITKAYEYSGDYTKTPETVPSIVTAQETFFDGRGNQTQVTNYGQVTTIIPGARLNQLENPRLDATFTDASAADPDGQMTDMTEYQRLGQWMDVPRLVNKSGYYTADRVTGERAKDDVKVLQAQTFDYDPVTFLVSKITDSLDTGPDPETTFEYDAYGNQIRVTLPGGNHTDMAYDSTYHAFPVRKTNTLGHVELFVFDPGFGSLLEYTDANSRTQSAQYDGLGRATARKDTAGNTITSYEYGYLSDLGGGNFAANRVRTITHTPTGDLWSEQQYDGLGRAFRSLNVGQRGPVDPLCTTTRYNDRGSTWRTSLPHWLSEAGSEHWNYSFLENDDALAPTGEWSRMGLNRTTKARQELNATDTAETLAVYETPLSQKTIDPMGHERRVVNDAFGRLVAVWEPNTGGSVGAFPNYEGQMTGYGYDAAGRLEYVRRHLVTDQDQAGDPVTNIWYDTLGRKIKMDDPDRGESTYAYDAAGNLINSVDARGVEILREYDVLDRLVRQFYPDVTSGRFLAHAFTYDIGTGTNLVGRLAQVRTPECTTQYSYDNEGRTILTQRVIDGNTYNVSGTFDYAGRAQTLVYPDGMTLIYGYDPATQLLDSITDPASGQVYLANKTLGKFGTPEGMVLGNNVTQACQFDFAGRIQDMQVQSGAQTLLNRHYTFGVNSSIQRIQEAAAPAPYGDMNYTYDAMDRLTSAWGTTMSGESAGTQIAPKYAYTYDALGRMTSNSRFANPAYTGYALGYEYSSDPAADRPTHAVRRIQLTRSGYPSVNAHEFTYDEVGNMLSSSNGAAALPQNSLTRTYSWDALGRMQSVSQGANMASFGYDHRGNRIKKAGPAGTVTYIGDLAEITSAGMTKHVFDGTRRIAAIKSTGERLFYTTDHLGSSTIITDLAGAKVQSMDYEPYGGFVENARSGNPAEIRHTYTGQEADTESGLMYYRARYYDPVVGMFASADAMAGSESSPESLNRYAYGGNNPANFVDSSGHFMEAVTLASYLIIYRKYIDPKGEGWGGMNYLGPGSDYADMKARGVEPSSPLDKVAMEHDRRYTEGGIQWDAYINPNPFAKEPTNDQREQQARADLIFARDASKAMFNVNSWNTPEKALQTAVFGSLGIQYFTAAAAYNYFKAGQAHVDREWLNPLVDLGGKPFAELGLWNEKAARDGSRRGAQTGELAGWCPGLPMGAGVLLHPVGYLQGGFAAGVTVGTAIAVGKGVEHAASEFYDEQKKFFDNFF